MATEKGLEPSTSGVTGRRSNQLNHSATALLIYQRKKCLSTVFLKFGLPYLHSAVLSTVINRKTTGPDQKPPSGRTAAVSAIRVR